MSVGPWQPLWIGGESRQLYAALHPVNGARTGVVMAPPLLHEQPRSRRVLVEVASQLAELGLPCLRFDYFGTGDSAGSGEQHDFAAIHDDLDVAAAALRDLGGVSRIVLLAWRGAALPIWSWAGKRQDLAVLALWEPIVDGGNWIAQLETTDRAERQIRYGDAQGDPGDTSLIGFPASRAWREDVATTRIAGTLPLPVWTIAGSENGGEIESVKHFVLSTDAPRFDDSASVEDMMFSSRGLFGTVDEFGRACVQLDD